MIIAVSWNLKIHKALLSFTQSLKTNPNFLGYFGSPGRNLDSILVLYLLLPSKHFASSVRICSFCFNRLVTTDFSIIKSTNLALIVALAVFYSQYKQQIDGQNWQQLANISNIQNNSNLGYSFFLGCGALGRSIKSSKK